MNSLLARFGLACFAVALIGLGIEHFAFGSFVTARAPAWPAGVRGQQLWAFATGAVFIAVGIAFLARRWMRPAAMVAATLIVGWALLRHIPVVARDSLLGGAWTGAGKALTFTGALLAIIALAPELESPTARSSAQRTIVPSSSHDSLLWLARIAFATFLGVSGLQHFRFAPFVASLIPTWFPGDPRFWGAFGGAALITGAVGLLVPRTARLAALGVGTMIGSWFFIIHVPRTFLSVSDGIALFEAMAFSGLGFLLAGATAPATRRRD